MAEKAALLAASTASQVQVTLPVYSSHVPDAVISTTPGALITYSE